MAHFPMRSKLTAGALIALLSGGLGAPASAAEPSAAGRTAVFEGVMECRGRSDAAERLACYDAAVATLDAAEKKGDVVVVDRQQAEAARKEAFGFSLPSLSMFERGEKTPDLDVVTFVAERAYQRSDGKWVVELPGGAVWVQNDTERMSRPAKAGSKVEIRKGALGGFFMKLDDQRAMRARRVQ